MKITESMNVRQAVYALARAIAVELDYGAPAGIVNAYADTLYDKLLDVADDFVDALDNDPGDTDGEAFRGHEAAGFASEAATRAQREK